MQNFEIIDNFSRRIREEIVRIIFPNIWEKFDKYINKEILRKSNKILLKKFSKILEKNVGNFEDGFRKFLENVVSFA